MLAGNSAFVPTSFESIATVTVGSGGAANVEFTSIPATYSHLQIRGIARSTNAGSGIDICLLQFNSDTGSNYARHSVGGNGSSTFTQVASSTTGIWVCAMWEDLISASMYGAAVVDILDYANTNKYKTVRSLEGLDKNSASGTTGEVALRSGLWQNTNAVTSIKLTANLKQYSHFAL